MRSRRSRSAALRARRCRRMRSMNQLRTPTMAKAATIKNVLNGGRPAAIKLMARPGLSGAATTQ